MRVIGTAGHVDHGKSTLVEALTGIHPDRLKEEREREMTIDLGFAWLTLPDGEEVGIIDVPGHKDFIENMLAGVGGIDAALFVIAADEGVMPQTREHLAILDLLQVQGGVVALTKIDLLEDGDAINSEWLDLVEEDVRQALKGSILEDAPLVRLSARRGLGLEELLQTLSLCLANRSPRPDRQKPRLPVDRIFTMPGFGTVATGTLMDGQLRVGDEIEILPAGLRGRVRGLQTHRKKEEIATIGSRTAVNITGVNVDQVHRGDVIAHPGDYRPTSRLDVQVRHLPEASQPIKHNTEVKFFIGSAEVVARVRLLGVETLLPGEEGWLQLDLRQPVVAVRGDRYIIRRPSPPETIGGGIVLDPHPRGRHKRFSKDLISRMESLAMGAPADVMLQTLFSLGAVSLRELVAQSNLEAIEADLALKELVQSKQLVILEDKGGDFQLESDVLVASRSYWDQIRNRLISEVERHHNVHPLRRGISKEELKSKLKAPARIFNSLVRRLIADNLLADHGTVISLADHEIRFNPQQERSVHDLLERFSAAPFAPPSVKEAQSAVSEEVYTALVEMGVLTQVSTDVVFRHEDYARLVEELRRLFAEQGRLTAAQARDHFKTSRRYILALLEHLDAIGLTVREGDVRRLRPGR